MTITIKDVRPVNLIAVFNGNAKKLSYGYKCPKCKENILYDKRVNENVIVFHCPFCGSNLMVMGVMQDGKLRCANPVIIEQ